MSLRLTRHRVLGAVLLLLLAIFVPPLIRLKRLPATMAVAIQNAVGRPVTASDVGIELLPQPGLTFSNFAVQDDPTFSAEPMLHAETVVARPRLSSLWRGRLEIGTLSLDNASLNLVRSPDGRWNLESLLNRATHIPTAPTGKARPEARPRFPYIEASNSRINFKSGQEKKVYAFVDSSFALWLESEGQWNMRLKGRVIRTDANLSDTGRIEISGSFRRPERLRDTPLNVRLVLDRAQLGQLTQLIYGRDRGWRGAVNVNATLSGTPASLNLSGDVVVNDFRRYDILSDDSLRLAAHCAGHYAMASQTLSGIDCRVPEQNGFVALSGTVSGPTGHTNYDLEVSARDLPMSELLRVARNAKRGLPKELRAAGTLNAGFTLRTGAAEQPPIWTGSGHADEFALFSPTLGDPLEFGPVNFSAGQQPASSGRTRRASPKIPSGFVIGPLELPLGGSKPVMVRATLSHSGYEADIAGDADLARLLATVRSLGGRAPQLKAEGAAVVNVALSGEWSGFAVPESTGTLQLRNTTAYFRGLNVPMHFKTADLVLSPDSITIRNAVASIAGTHTTVNGTASLPRSCASFATCPLQVNLHASELSSDELNRMFNPRLRDRPWYELGFSATDSLLPLQVQGHVFADRVLIKSAVLNHVSGQFQMSSGKLVVSGMQGDSLAGKLKGALEATFTGNQPSYVATGSLARAAVAQVAALTHDAWATGTLSADFRIAMNGDASPELLRSLSGTMDFELRDGVLPHLKLAGPDPLVYKRIWGRARWHNSRLELSECRLQAGSGVYTLAGTAGRQLDLQLIGANSHSYNISGSLDKPHVTLLTTPATQAALKQ
jgi:hypothetical protein